MNANEINEKYEVTQYEEDGTLMLVMPAYQNLIPVNVTEVAKANGLPLKEVEITRSGAVFIGGEVIQIGHKERSKTKVAMKWEKEPRPVSDVTAYLQFDIDGLISHVEYMEFKKAIRETKK